MADLTNIDEKSGGRRASPSRRKKLKEDLSGRGIAAILGAIVGVFGALKMPDQLRDNPFVGFTILGLLFGFLACLVVVQYRPTNLPLWMVVGFGTVAMVGAVGSGIWTAQKTKFNLQATGLEDTGGKIRAVAKFGQYAVNWNKKTPVDIEINGDRNLDLSEIIHYYDQQMDCATVANYALKHADVCEHGPSPARK